MAVLWSERGQTHNDMHQYEKAVADCSKAIELDSEQPLAWNSLGIGHRHLGKQDKALEEFSKAIELDPKFATFWSNRGSVYCDSLHQYEKAMSDFSTAIALDPKFATAWANRGNARRGLGQWGKAIADYSKAIELDQESRNLTQSSPRSWPSAQDPKFQDAAEAVKLARKAVKVCPTYAGSWQALGWALYRTGNWKESIEAFRKSMAYQENPKGGDAGQWFGLAADHWQLGNKEKARKWHDQAVQWAEKNSPQDEFLNRLRGEAEKVLELKK